MENNKTVVVNRHSSQYDVYIGRGTSFGNPFIIGRDGTREEVLRRYKRYFNDRILLDKEFKKKVLALRGKVLGCSCKPDACHGDIIVSWLQENTDE